jgi:hypothetical protein
MLPRLRGLLTAPSAEFTAIAAGPVRPAAILLGWLAPMALLPFAATVLRVTLFASIFGAQTSWDVLPALVGNAAAQYLFLIVWVCAVAWVADELAPRFGGRRGYARAFAAVAFALAPAFVLSLSTMLPLVGVLALAGLPWWVWLLRLGLPRLMGAPDERALKYAVTVAVAGLLLALLALLVPDCRGPIATEEGSGVAAVLVPAPGGAAVVAGRGAATTSPDERLVGIDKEGAGALNLEMFKGASVGEALENLVDPDMVREFERVAREAARVDARIPFKPAEPSMLGELMPATGCNLARVELESKLSKLPTGDVAQATARFGQFGGPVLRMEIGDRSPLATGLRVIRPVMGTRTTTNAQGYTRYMEDGTRYIDNRWNVPRKEDRYAVLLAERFVVSAVVTGVETPGCAEAAVRSVDWAALEAMAGSPAR